MVLKVTLKNISVISWRSVLLVEEIGVPVENHRPVASHWQTLSHNVVSSTASSAGLKITTLVVIDTDYIGSCKSNYHTITTSPRSTVILQAKQNGIKPITFFHVCKILLCDIFHNGYILNKKATKKYPAKIIYLRRDSNLQPQPVPCFLYKIYSI